MNRPTPRPAVRLARSTRRTGRRRCLRSGAWQARTSTALRGSHQSSSGFPKILRQGSKLAGVMTRATQRARVERLTYLPHAGSLNTGCAAGKLQARPIPLEAAKAPQVLRGRARLAHQSIVVEFQDVRAVERLPVGHQPAVLAGR